jgi:hydroxymethylbilane synthase
VDLSQKWEVKEGALIGTSSARRKVQLKKHRPDIRLDDIRGNVPTRVNKLRDGMFDAIVLAKAGLDRLEYDVSDLHVHLFDPTEFIPAPAQGALAIQIRESDRHISEIVAHIHREDIAATTSIERTVLNPFHGGCQMPLGAYCLSGGNGTYELRDVMAESVGHNPVYVELSGTEPEALARDAVKQLKTKAREAVS